MSDRIENLRRAVGLVIMDAGNATRIANAIDQVEDEMNELQMKINTAKGALA